jgi:hypothetical protein
MAIDLVEYETKAREAVQAFWGNREQARRKQIESGRVDAGERGAVTAGKNMDGFIALVIALVRANGLADAEIYRSRALLTLPGYFRPTKLWDLLVFHKGRLVAALECKSQVGPSFGNNFNNRAEEAIGTAHDFQGAYREGGSLRTDLAPVHRLAHAGGGCPRLTHAGQRCLTALPTIS